MCLTQTLSSQAKCVFIINLHILRSHACLFVIIQKTSKRLNRLSKIFVRPHIINGNLYARSKLKISNISDTKKPSIKTKKICLIIYYYKDLFTQDKNTYINGVVYICLNKFFGKYRFPKEKRKNMQNYAQIENIDFYSLHNIFIISVIT